MNEVAQTKTQIRRSITRTKLPYVCMHVLGDARTDARVIREAKTLTEAGFAVSIIDVVDNPTLSVEEEIQGIHVKHIIMPGWHVSTRFKPWFLVKITLLFICSAFHLIQVKADIYHAHDDTALLPCFVAACLYRKPLIFDAHELPLSEPSVTRWHKLASVSRRLLAVMISYCVGVITVSPPIMEEMRKRYKKIKVTLVRNVPPYRAVPKSDKLRQYLGLNPDVRIALYQGNLQSNRNLDLLVHAAPFLEDNIVIVLMGPAVKTTQNRLESLIVCNRVADRVRLIPPVPYAELLDWTASADIGLTLFRLDYSLSIRWCLPNKFFEYLMAGLPVCSSPLDAIVEIIKAYDVGRVTSSLEPSAIGATINAMLSDTVALAHMRNNALEVARREFNWEKESRKLVQLYHSVMTSSTSLNDLLPLEGV